tara:strand:+ start:354 stop:602 length:249 start_codon:yes stop_codon:yes gene_type:complete
LVLSLYASCLPSLPFITACVRVLTAILAIDYAQIAVDSYEADDIIAKYAIQLTKLRRSGVIVSTDKGMWCVIVWLIVVAVGG